MKTKISLIVMLAIVASLNVANAQEPMQEKAECQGECPIAAAMESLPKMTYKVGEEATCCSESAAELAKKSEMPIHFVVGEETFEAKEAAFTALVEQTETYVNEFITPCKCEVSGKTKIAGKACDCPVEAGKTSELVQAAANKVQMTYAVGEKTCNCPMEAAKLVEASGAKKEFVVAGEKTCCEMTARLNLARAKYKAAVEVLAANTTASTTTGG
jgi:hypothetical protein